MAEPGKEDLSSVLAAIRKMVHDETRANFTMPEKAEKPEEAPPETPVKPAGTSLANVYILRPHQRVAPPKPSEILEEGDKLPYDEQLSDSFSIANPDDDVLRDMVREVVQEQLRGDMGREIVAALKKEMLLALSDKS